MKKLLLPYAYDSTGNLVHIDNAHKGETYTCPECGKVLSLNISKIPEGQKYHRRNHFSHPKGSPDNQCTESFMHKLFKERAAECIRGKIENGNAFEFVWQCRECDEVHVGNMLKKAETVCLEYDLGVCRPDVALLDADGKVVIVIEVVVTHKPEPEVMAYYNDNKIGCLQISVSDFDDCENVERKLMRPDFVNLCPTPICKKCGKKMQKAKMVIGYDTCWRCGSNMEIAIIKSNGQVYSPEDFNEEEVRLANENGAFVVMNYSNQMKESYFANTCKHCKAFVGQHHIHDYYEMPHEKEIDLGYKCYNCVILEKQKKFEAQREMARKLNEKIMKDGVRTCPECGGRLVPRKGKDGYFYGCGNYPNCRYTENIILGNK